MTKNNYRLNVLIYCLPLLLSISTFAQKQNIDSLKNALIAQTSDTSRLHTLEQLCNTFFRMYLWDSVTIYSNMQLELAIKINSPLEKAKAYRNIGYNAYCKNNNVDALANLNKALKIANEVNANKEIARITVCIGKVNYQLGQYSLALKNELEALSMLQKDENTISLLEGYFFCGLCYEVLHNYTQSLKYYLLALRTDEKIGFRHNWEDEYFTQISLTQCAIGNIYNLQENTAEALKWISLAEVTNKKSKINDRKLYNEAYINNCLGETYCKQGKYELALQKQYSALEYWKNYNNIDGESWSMPLTYKNIGDVFKKRGESSLTSNGRGLAKPYLDSAIYYYNLLLKSSKKGTDKSYIPSAYVNFAKIYLLLNDEHTARKYLDKGLPSAINVGDKESIKESYLCLFKLDSIHGNLKNAIENYKMYIIYRDSITGQEATLLSESFKLEYEFDKKNEELKLLSAKNLLEVEISNQKKQLAYISFVFFVLLFAYIFYRIAQRKKLQNKNAMIAERFRISQELHDEVGATLSGIAMYSHLAKEQIKNTQTGAIQNSLNIIQSNAGEMVNKLNDIVWLINPGQDSLQKLMQRLEDYAVQIAAVKNIRVKSNLNGHYAKNILPAETRRNIYLLFKEAINNAVKYSNATLLELNVKEDNTEIQISLKDNGDGFDVDIVKHGNGLDNMQQRAKDMQTDCVIESAKGKGTSITVIIKIP
jgi:signal transduction histidine kinase